HQRPLLAFEELAAHLQRWRGRHWRTRGPLTHGYPSENSTVRSQSAEATFTIDENSALPLAPPPESRMIAASGSIATQPPMPPVCAKPTDVRMVVVFVAQVVAVAADVMAVAKFAFRFWGVM